MNKKTKKTTDKYKIRKVRGQDCYKVYNSVTKRVFSKCTTKEKATRQLAIIRTKIYTPPLAIPNKSVTNKTI